MSNKRKLRIRALAAKTGKSLRGAANLLNKQQPPPRARTIEELLRELKVTSMFGVLAGRISTRAASASLLAATEQVSELVRNPKWYLESGAFSTLVRFDEFELALAAAAANDEITDILRTFRTDQGTTFSLQCERCNSWIWCADVDHEGFCFCGRNYRVIFDLPEVLHWSQPQRLGMACIDCGCERRMTEPREGRNPWRLLNQWQTRCNACTTKSLLPLNSH